jgi:hypothetical protein
MANPPVIRELLSVFLKPRVTSGAPIASDDKQRLATIARPLKERVLSMRAVEVGRGRFDQAIVGESHYQDVLRHVRNDDFIAVGDRPIATFLLAREPDNPHDCNAIAVLTAGGDVVGYLSREDAVRLQPTLLEHEEREEVLSCTGKLVGDDIIGVWLNGSIDRSQMVASCSWARTPCFLWQRGQPAPTSGTTLTSSDRCCSIHAEMTRQAI